MTPYDFIGKFIQYTGKEKVKITDIKVATGYPEFFQTYYEIYYIENDIQKRYVNLPEEDFNDKNPIFCINE